MGTRKLNALGLLPRGMRAARTDLVAYANGPGDGWITGMAILGRATMHAWRLGDMTDEEAAGFIDDVIEDLL